MDFQKDWALSHAMNSNGKRQHHLIRQRLVQNHLNDIYHEFQEYVYDHQIFLIFHQISFTNDLWILNPETDFLLIMFPESFFRDVAIMIVVLAILINLLLFLSIRKLKQYI